MALGGVDGPAGGTACELEPGATAPAGSTAPGDVVVHVPASHVASAEVGQAGRVAALHAGGRRKPFYRRSPYLRSASAFTVGGTIPAVHAETVRDEILGRQRRRCRATVPARARAGARRRGEPLVVEVAAAGSGEDGWRAWERVEHFDASAATDRHFRLDAATGEIVFGPGVRQLDGTLRQYGAVPDLAAPVRAAVYRVGGGSRGNVAAGAITTLRTSVPFVARGSATAGPPPAASTARTSRRSSAAGPAFLRTRQRAVTTSDYEYLATAADPRAARTRGLAGQGAEQAVSGWPSSR